MLIVYQEYEEREKKGKAKHDMGKVASFNSSALGSFCERPCIIQYRPT